jgi:hypothetical protein
MMLPTTILARLLEATPLPPKDADVETLLAAFEQSHAARAAILADVSESLDTSSAEARELLHHLATRQHLWREALAAAIESVKQAQVGVGKLRRYGDGLKTINL